MSERTTVSRSSSGGPPRNIERAAPTRPPPREAVPAAVHAVTDAPSAFVAPLPFLDPIQRAFGRGKRTLTEQAEPDAQAQVPGKRPLPPRAGAGAPLPAAVRTKMERGFASDFSAVRVHEDGAAEAMGAVAFARGDDIHVAAGVLGSSRGDKVLGHELAHVWQQRNGRGPAGGGAGFAIEPGLEAEAAQLGNRAAHGEVVATATTSVKATGGGAPAQPLLGFELEINVLVSRHIGKARDEDAEQLPVGAQEGEIRWVEGKGYRWRNHPGKADLEENVITPTNYNGSGRWVHWDEWQRRPEMDNDEDAFADPMMSKESFFRGDQVSGKVDHAPGLDVGRRHYQSIVELVTDAKDERAADFLTPMEEAVELANKIERQIVKTGQRKQVAEVLGSSLDSNLWLGVNLNTGEQQFQSTEAYVQATYGVRLGSIDQLISLRQRQHGTVNRDGHVYKQTIDAMTSLHGQLDHLGISLQKTPHLMGYLELVCLYLVGGHPDNRPSGTAKNSVPLLVRQRFDQMRSDTVPPTESQLISHPKVRDELAKVMLQVTERSAEQSLYPTSLIKAGTWLARALAGNHDELWETWDSSKEVRSEAVGTDREMAPALEERNPPPAGTRIKQGGWIDFATQRGKELQLLNAPPQGSGSGGNQSGNQGVLPSARLDNSQSVQPSAKAAMRPLNEGEANTLKKGAIIFLPDDTEAVFLMLTGKAGCYAKWNEKSTGKEMGDKFSLSEIKVPE